MDVEGDYSDILLYFSNLFAKNRVKSVNIDRFNMEYCEATVLVDVSNGRTEIWDDFPDKNAPDRVTSLSLLVSGLKNSKVSLEIHNEFLRFNDDIAEPIVSYFLEVLDRSTFRFF